MSNTHLTDRWDEAHPYERYVGRWSSLVAHAFLEWLAMPPALTWLEVGCGTGALTAAISAQCEPSQVIGVEPSEGFLALARKRLPSTTVLYLGSATDIPIDDHHVDLIVSGLVLNFIPHLADALKHMTRKVKPTGTLAAYVWDYASGMQMMRFFWNAAVQLNPAASQLDEGVRFPLCQPEALAAAFAGANLGAIQIAPITIPTFFANFDDFWMPFLGGQGPAPSYVSTLTDAAQQELRERLRGQLPIAPDGSIALLARAWAVRATVPS